MNPDLPPLLLNFIAWAESNPAKGAVVVLLAVAGGLWLLRRAIKVFIGLALILVVFVISSYFFIGGKETNTLIRDGAREGIDRAEELSEEIRDGLREELLKPAGQ